MAAALRYPQLPAALCQRLARAYGARIETLLASGPNGLGPEVAPGLFEAELDYLQEHEWARSADAVLWRRSKLGLHLSATQRAAVVECFAAHWPGPATSITASRPTEPAWN